MLVIQLFIESLRGPCEFYFHCRLRLYNGVRCIKYQPSTILRIRHMVVAIPRQKVPSKRGIWHLDCEYLWFAAEHGLHLHVCIARE